MPLQPFRSFFSGLALCLLPLALSCSNGTSAAVSTTTPTPVPAVTPIWAVAWGASPENAIAGPENQGGSEQSFRSFFVPTVAGTEERVHFSNLFGTTPLVIGSARLAVATGVPGTAAGVTPAIDATHDAALTFSGAKGVTIPAGQEIVSDPVNVTFTFGQKMAVSFYLSGSFPALTQHESQVTTNYVTPAGAGDTTTDATGAAFSVANTEWFVVTGVDVYGGYGGTVAIFGSSSVDGHGSNYSNTNSYPAGNVAVPGQDNDRPSDWLARELQAAGYNIGVLNAGTIGDPAGDDVRTLPGAGAIAGIDRMKHDVLGQAGIKAVVIYFGGIDLRADCVPATNVETSLTNMVAQAQAAGVRVILATLPPSEYCQQAAPLPSAADPYAGDVTPGPENPGSTERRALNDWIRTTGATLPGVVAIADFDKVLADPNHPDFMIANLNSGDNFHPNGAGYGVQSGAISLSSILGQ